MPASGKYWYKPLIDKSTESISTQSQHQMIDDEADVLAIWRTLTLRVSHEPENLKLHTQRLLFGLENEVSEYIPGALQDLFISLGKKGFSLRQRLFNLVSPVMAQADRIYFQQWLADDTDKNLACQRLLGAVFKSETCQAVENDNDNSGLLTRPAFNNQLAEARFNIAAGQIVKAQALLENTYLKDGNNSDVLNELHTLYLCTKNKEAVAQFTQKLSENSGQLPEVWSKLLSISQSW